MPPRTLKLKQRLATLSLAQSSLSTPTTHESPTSDTWSPTTAKRKFFNPPWMKRPTSPTTTRTSTIDHGPEFTDSVVVQEVLSKMIFQAGVDFE